MKCAEIDKKMGISPSAKVSSPKLSMQPLMQKAAQKIITAKAMGKKKKKKMGGGN